MNRFRADALMHVAAGLTGLRKQYEAANNGDEAEIAQITGTLPRLAGMPPHSPAYYWIQRAAETCESCGLTDSAGRIGFNANSLLKLPPTDYGAAIVQLENAYADIVRDIAQHVF